MIWCLSISFQSRDDTTEEMAADMLSRLCQTMVGKPGFKVIKLVSVDLLFNPQDIEFAAESQFKITDACWLVFREDKRVLDDGFESLTKNGTETVHQLIDLLFDWISGCVRNVADSCSHGLAGLGACFGLEMRCQRVIVWPDRSLAHRAWFFSSEVLVLLMAVSIGLPQECYLATRALPLGSRPICTTPFGVLLGLEMSPESCLV